MLDIVKKPYTLLPSCYILLSAVTVVVKNGHVNF